MDDNVINDFIVIFNPFSVIDLESFEKMESYKETLNKFYARFIERVDKNYFELSDDEKNANYYLRKVVEKLENHRDLLFVKEDNIITYFYKKSITVIPILKGNVNSEASNAQYYYLNKAIDHFNKQLSGTTSEPISQKNQEQQIIKEALGFRIKNETNLLGAWRLLTKNKFIANDPRSYEIFERNFTGQKILHKIKWIKSDKCLHYFIDGIYGKPGNYGLGVDIEPNGQWEKTADCFCKKDGTSYDPGNLSRTKNPSDQTLIDKLCSVIAQINKQPKKKD